MATRRSPGGWQRSRAVRVITGVEIGLAAVVTVLMFLLVLLQAVQRYLPFEGFTWTAAHLTDWIAQHHGVRLSVDRVRRHLRRAGLSWQRTSRSLKHKQDPTEVAQRQAVLTDLEKRGTWATSISAISMKRALP